MTTHTEDTQVAEWMESLGFVHHRFGGMYPSESFYHAEMRTSVNKDIARFFYTICQKADIAGRLDELSSLVTTSPEVNSDWIDSRVLVLEAKARAISTTKRQENS